MYVCMYISIYVCVYICMKMYVDNCMYRAQVLVALAETVLRRPRAARATANT